MSTNISQRGAIATDLQNSESGFRAPKELANALQQVLVELIDLQLIAKQAHWNVVGPNFRDLHLNLDEIVDIARAASDVVAERMRAIHVAPDGRTGTVVADSSLPEIPAGEISTHEGIRLMVSAIEATVRTIRDIRDTVDDADPASADVLHGFIVDLEQQAWFLAAELREV